MRASILLVDDDQSMREVLEVLLRRHKFRVTAVSGGQEACDLLEEREFDLVITDLKMPRVGGMDVLAKIKQLHPQTEVVVVTAYATTETAVEAMKLGAYDYLTKPYKVEEILVTVERALEKRALVRENVSLREQLMGRNRLDRMVGRSEPMQKLFALIRQVAATRSSVLITGESGTGKELVARAIHGLGDRTDKPFVPVNCAAIPDALMESELFGHLKGAFTGADRDRTGLFAAADGGTLFLDEIAELSLNMQVKILRTLQERTIVPVGGVNELAVDVRIIAATNRDLDHEVEQGRFRPDLFYRLHVIPIPIPPLREREGDIPLLAEHFATKFAAEMNKPFAGFTSEALALLCGHNYPGNVRELENLVERAVALSSGDTIGADALPDVKPAAVRRGDPGTVDLPPEGLDLDAYMGQIERRLLEQALDRTKGNRTEAARLLRITLRSIRYRLAKYSGSQN
jgi:two-component system response regulator PilR (NtrC family)